MQNYLEQLYAEQDAKALKNEYKWMQEHWHTLLSITDPTHTEALGVIASLNDVYSLCGRIQEMVWSLGGDIEQEFKLQ